MAYVPTGSAQYLEKYGDKTIVCNPFILSRLGFDQNRCFIKIEEYIIPTVPFQLGFKRSLFMASLSSKELSFFQHYTNSIGGLSLALSPPRQDPVKFFIRCNLTTIGQMKGRENTGLFVVDFKTIPDELAIILGSYLENLGRGDALYEEHGEIPIRITSETAKIMGFTMTAVITSPEPANRHVQIICLNTKLVEHLEPAGSAEWAVGSDISYQLFFNRFKITITGTVKESKTLPQGVVQTTAHINLSHELVGIVDDYWFNVKMNPIRMAPLQSKNQKPNKAQHD
ncbi:MAG: hypothetical protein LBG76_06565 [Treponema sp.]|jgi:hypothetical protein|nr:hypothetical protein [Treponema sp.]